jgi:hypothetical protein
MNQMRIKTTRLAAIATLLFSLIIGCATAQKHWDAAISADTIAVYEQFLRQHPKGELAEQARSRLDQLITQRDWESTSSADTIAAYDQFLRQHPKGELAEQARSRAEAMRTDSVDWEKAQEINTVKGYIDFLESHPHSLFSDRAKGRIDDQILKLADWNDGSKIAESLESSGWVPSSDWEKVHYWVAKRKRGYLIIYWNLTKETLLQVIQSPKNNKELENAIYALVGLGVDEIIPHLERIMDSNGNKQLAEAYLNCNNAILYKRAKEWANAHGYSISSGFYGHHPVSWGGM